MEDHARQKPNEASKTWQRVNVCSHSCERTLNKLNRRHQKHGLLTQSQSPSTGPSHQKAFVTPKRTRLRYGSSGSSYVESPDAVHDIIWDSSSPPPVWNGPGPEKTPQITDIVNRIAPKERDKNAQSSPFFQWLGKDALSCTPDIPPPRVRRKSVRQNSVEDLKKLALEFDLRVSNGQEQQQQQQSGPSDNHPSSSEAPHLDGLQEAATLDEELNALFDSSTQRLSRPLSQGSSICSQESRPGITASSAAVADGPGLPGAAPKKGTGRFLSITTTTSSSSSSSSSVTAHADLAHTITGTPAIANVAATENVTGKGDFDDDWENDDLLNDSFVLEMTQQPVILDSPPVATAQAPESSTSASQHAVSKVTDLAIKVNPSVSACTAGPGRAGPSGIEVCGHSSSGSASGVQMGTRAKATVPTDTTSAFMSELAGVSQHKITSARAARALRLDASDATKHEHGKRTHAQSSSRDTAEEEEEEKKKGAKEEAQTVTVLTKIRKQTAGSESLCPQARKSSKGITDEKDRVESPTSVSEDAWGSGGDTDDDLLYQVCDVVERLSASQEEAQEAAVAVAAVAGNPDKKPAPSLTRQLSLSPSHCVPARAKSTFTASKSWPPPPTSLSSSGKRPLHTFSRSLSMPYEKSPSVVTTAVLPSSSQAHARGAPGVSAGLVIPTRTVPRSTPVANQLQQQYRFTQLKPHGPQQHTPSSAAAGPQSPNSTSTHHSTTKRPLQEPRPLSSKVFVPNQRPVKCSAAEIERKKQDAIARRKLRLEASQKPSTPT